METEIFIKKLMEKFLPDYLRGFECGKNGGTLSCHPYLSENCDEYREYETGWYDARSLVDREKIM